jgi:hypothetical protein
MQTGRPFISTSLSPPASIARIHALFPERDEIGARLCAKHSRSDQDSTLKSSAASGVFQPAGLAKLLRLVFDTAALRGSARHAPVALARL